MGLLDRVNNLNKSTKLTADDDRTQIETHKCDGDNGIKSFFCVFRENGQLSSKKEHQRCNMEDLS